MAGAQATRIISEEDDDDQSIDLPGGGAPSSGGSNVDVPSPAAAASAADDEFEIIEDEPQQTDWSRGGAEPSMAGRDQQAVQRPVDQANQDRQPSRRERQRYSREKQERELAELRGQVSNLTNKLTSIEPRFTEIDNVRRQTQINDVSRAMDENAQRAAQLATKFVQLVNEGDGAQAAQVMQEREKLILQGSRLEAQRNLLVSGNPFIDRPQQRQAAPPPQQQAPQQQAAAPAPSPVVQRFYDNFLDRHEWFDPENTADPDSEVVRAIDRAVYQQGYRPDTRDYWEQIENQMARMLPHRVNGQQAAGGQQQPRAQTPAPRRGPMVAGPSERQTAPGKNQVHMTPGRKDALIEAGILDRDGRTVLDRGRWAKQLREYQNWDRENASARN